MSNYEAPQIEQMMIRMMRALVKRAGDGELEALEALANLEHQAGLRLKDAVHAYREGPAAASWTDIGRIMGTSRQTAHERFGKAAQL